VIAQAQLPGNGNCATPTLARKVFGEMLQSKKLKWRNNKERVRWVTVNNIITDKFLIPGVQSDVNVAFGSGSGSIEAVYREVIDEMEALRQDPDAKTYTPAAGGAERPIDLERFAKIRKIYQELESRDLAPGQILAFDRQNAHKGSTRRHKGLEDAVAKFLANAATNLITYEAVDRHLRGGDGGAEIKGRISEISHAMRSRLGYCAHCMKSAVSLSKQAGSSTEQVRDNQ
jgi:hypothetical protein